jgi:uroporphyrin-3 C-methyltransferase
MEYAAARIAAQPTMETTADAKQPASASTPSAIPMVEQDTRARAALRTLWVIVVVAILGAAYAWYVQNRDAQALRAEIAQRLASADAQATQAKARDSDLANELRDAQAKLALLEARVAEFQSQQSALEALYRDLAPSRDELTVSEVEQILVLASQQLSLGGNVRAALTALQVADAKLARLDRPALGPLRRALARDMDRLKAVPYVDIAGISIRIDQIIEGIDALPLAKDERVRPPPQTPEPANESPWVRFLHDVWNDLRSVIRIEVTDRPPAPLVTPEQSFFLRENLRLRLLAARLALLARDERSFKADLAAAREWAMKYFDRGSPQVQSVLSTLAQLASIPMPTEVPELTASLDAIRTLKASLEREQASSAPR